jgi:serine/threonine protein kinase
MRSILTSDEDLIRRLPLPLAQLYRRAHNAKTALERHLAAFYLWEAWLKLLATVAVVEYAERDRHDPALAERLQNLARPSLGHWWDFARGLVPALADAGAGGFAAVREVVLGRARADLPRAVQLDAALAQTLDGKGGARATVRPADLFDRLVRYRNRELGHGASGQRSGDFYEQMGWALLAGVAEVVGRADALAGRQLLYVAEVRGLASGGWLVERYDLTGETARRAEPLELAPADAALLPRARSLSLAADGVPQRLLAPLLVYEEDTQEVFFLNSRRGRRRAEYLCYTSGRVLDRDDLGPERRALLARVLGMPVGEETSETWAARGQAEEAPEAAAPAAGRRSVGEFELLGKLGQGGMGVVYRAWQPSLGRQVALKCLLSTGDPKAEARFAREIRALGKVEHPHLVKVFTSGADGDQWFYAMELLEGADLGRVCEHLAGRDTATVGAAGWQQAVTTACTAARDAEESLDGSALPRPPAPAPPPAPPGRDHVRQVVELVRQVASAAHALHEAGVVHRDIKPGNILVGPDGRHAALTDLGLAQLADEGDARLTRTRQFVGTLRYASPEQVLAGDRLDRRSDVYSLGATLWELLTLRPMYGADDRMAPFEVEKRITLGEPESARKFNRRVPADLDAVVLKCLEKDPARRYQTAGELADDLGRFLAGEPVRARPIGVLRRGARWVRRRPLRTLGAVTLLLGLLLGGWGLWFWDAHYRVKAEYYANYVKRRGAPEGLGRLSEEETHHRIASYRLSRRGGRAERLEVVNSRGQLTAVHSLAALLEGKSDPTVFKRDCRYEFAWDAQGRLAEEVACDRAGAALWRLQYTTPETAHYTDRAGFVQPRAQSGAAYVGLTWSPEGFLQQVRYFDHAGKPQPNGEGSFGEHYDLDGRGLAVRVTNLGADGKPAAHPDGYVSIRKTYDDAGNVTETAYLGPDDRPALHRNGYHRIVRRYDDHGNETESAYYGLDGKPALHRSGYHKDTTAYDESAGVISTAYLGVDGAPVTGRLGFARITAKWDAAGNLGETAVFGPDGKPCLMTEGYHRITMEWDEHGNCTAGTAFGVDGQPARHKDGYHRVTRQFDEHGNRHGEQLWGPDGRPAWHRNGFTRLETSYDDRDHPVEQSFYDDQGRLTRNRAGYARWTGDYDERGNLQAEHPFDEQGRPVRLADGAAGYRMAYDGRGYLREQVTCDEKGDPTPNAEGYAKRVMDYDARGNCTETAYFGPGGEPATNRNGVARRTAAYDACGNQTRETSFGPDGKPVRQRDGYAEWRAEYDERGNCRKKTYHDEKGNLTPHRDGNAGWTARHDDRGNEVERTYLGRDGKPLVLPGEGYARQATDYDARGLATRVTFFDADGRPVRATRWGAAGWSDQYEAHGNLSERVYLGPDGKPCRGADGYVRTTKQYDDSGNPVDSAYFDADGNELRTEVVVDRVDPGGQGERLGLRAGDVLASYDGQALANGVRWSRVRRAEHGGDPPKELRVRRGDQVLTFAVAPGLLGIRTRERALNPRTPAATPSGPPPG